MMTMSMQRWICLPQIDSSQEFQFLPEVQQSMLPQKRGKKQQRMRYFAATLLPEGFYRQFKEVHNVCNLLLSFSGYIMTIKKRNIFTPKSGIRRDCRHNLLSKECVFHQIMQKTLGRHSKSYALLFQRMALN